MWRVFDAIFCINEGCGYAALQMRYCFPLDPLGDLESPLLGFAAPLPRFAELGPEGAARPISMPVPLVLAV